MKYLIALLPVLFLAGCAPYHVQHDLAYGPGARQTYDFYEPRVDVAGTPRPALLVIHGGGYVSGDKEWAEAVAKKFCPWGYVVIAINYTLASPADIWPRQLNDAKAALAHVRDPSTDWMNIRLPITGFGVSAGAHLVSALHLQGDLAAAIAASGPYDFVNNSNAQLDGTLRVLLGLPAAEPIPMNARVDLSPASWSFPAADMLLVHAKRDPLTVYEHAQRMKQAVQDAGGKVKLVTIDSSSHGSAWKDAMWSMLRWLQKR